MKPRNPKISRKERLEVYRPYFVGLPEKRIRALLRGTEGESIIATARGFFKGELSWEKAVFEAHLNRYFTYPRLAKEFNVSERAIKDAISRARIELMNDVTLDVKLGNLPSTKNITLRKKSTKSEIQEAIRDWESYVQKLINSKK